MSAPLVASVYTRASIKGVSPAALVFTDERASDPFSVFKPVIFKVASLSWSPLLTRVAAQSVSVERGLGSRRQGGWEEAGQ